MSVEGKKVEGLEAQAAVAEAELQIEALRNISSTARSNDIKDAGRAAKNHADRVNTTRNDTARADIARPRQASQVARPTQKPTVAEPLTRQRFSQLTTGVRPATISTPPPAPKQVRQPDKAQDPRLARESVVVARASDARAAATPRAPVRLQTAPRSDLLPKHLPPREQTHLLPRLAKFNPLPLLKRAASASIQIAKDLGKGLYQEAKGLAQSAKGLAKAFLQNFRGLSGPAKNLPTSNAAVATQPKEPSREQQKANRLLATDHSVTPEQAEVMARGLDARDLFNSRFADNNPLVWNQTLTQAAQREPLKEGEVIVGKYTPGGQKDPGHKRINGLLGGRGQRA